MNEKVSRILLSKASRLISGVLALSLVVVPTFSVSAHASASQAVTTKATAKAAATSLSTPKLSALANSAAGVIVKWSKVSGATGYRVYRKAAAEKSWTKITTIKSGATVSYTDKSVKSGSKYTYTVRAYNTKTTSPYNKTGVTILYLAAPKTLNVANITSGVSVKWSKVTGASGYYVYRKVNSDKSWTKVTLLNGNSTCTYIDVNAKSGNKYSYLVKACNGSVKGGYKTNSIFFLKAPALLGVTSNGTTITLKWSGVYGAKGYNVYRAAANGGYSIIAKLYSGSSVKFTDTTAKVGAKYKYTVRAFSGNCLSTFNQGLVITNKVSSTAWTKAKAFNFYKDAVLEIKNDAVAGHTRKEWQEIEEFNLGGSSALVSIIESFVTNEADAELRTSARGSAEAKDLMCPCGASLDNVKSATCQEVNGNYKITIVMKNEVNPKKGSDGVASMSTGILYMDDVKDTIADDPTVSKLVKNLDDSSQIEYQNYTITATMTKDGEFISIKHSVAGVIDAGAKLIIGSVSGSGTIVFNSQWTDFKY